MKLFDWVFQPRQDSCVIGQDEADQLTVLILTNLIYDNGNQNDGKHYFPLINIAKI
jgi:hypothetical protein